MVNRERGGESIGVRIFLLAVGNNFRLWGGASSGCWGQAKIPAER